MKRKISVLLVLFGLLASSFAPLTTSVGAQTVSIEFERTKEGVTYTEFRVTVTNLEEVKQALPLTVFFEDLSYPIENAKSIKMWVWDNDTYVVQVPIYDVIQVNKTVYNNETELNETIVVGFENQTRWQHIREPLKEWYFAGLKPDVIATINIPSNEDDEGWGYGVKVFDIRIEHGLHQRPDGLWGSAGLMKWDVGGDLFYDDTNSSWWNSSWNKKAPLQINNGCNTALEYYQVYVNLTYDSDMNSDFSDIRIVNESAGAEVPLWNETVVDGKYAEFYFNATSIPASSWLNDTYYVYYGNPSATSVSDWTTTVLLRDYFDDGDYTNDPTWTVGSGTWDASSGYLTSTSGHISTPSTSADAEWRFKWKIAVGASWAALFMSDDPVGWSAGTNCYYFYWDDYADTIYLKEYSGDAHQTLDTYEYTGNDGNYYDVRITRDQNGLMKVYLKSDTDANFSTETEILSATDTTITTSSYFVIKSAVDGALEFDNFLVRKYASPEPDVVVGAEEEQPVAEYIPPTPTNLQNTTGNFWVNHTWQAGTGNVTDSYNVSVNGTWHNGTTDTFYNNSGLSPHGWSNITVWAFNSSGSGTLSAGSVSDNVQIPNNPPVLGAIGSQTVDENQTLSIDADATDADSDTLTYSCNRTDLFTDFNTSTGEGNWTPTFADSGTYYVDFGVSDGYGGTDNETVNITVNDVPLTITDQWNNVTENSTTAFTTNESTTTEFGITTNRTPTYVRYYVNDVLKQNTSSLNYSHSWSNTDAGTWTVNVSAKDDYDTTTNTTWTVTVENPAPVWSTIPTWSFDEDTTNSTLDLDDYCTDADGDALTFTIIQEDAANITSSINATTHIVTFTPRADWNGNATFQYRVDDGQTTVDSGTHTVQVVSVNDPPTFSNSSVSTTSVLPGGTIDISVDVVDDHGNITSVKVEVEKPSGDRVNYTMTLDSGNTYTVTYTDTTSQIGDYNIVNFYVEDDADNSNSTTSALKWEVLYAAGHGGGYWIPPGVNITIPDNVTVIVMPFDNFSEYALSVPTFYVPFTNLKVTDEMEIVSMEHYIKIPEVFIGNWDPNGAFVKTTRYMFKYEYSVPADVNCTGIFFMRARAQDMFLVDAETGMISLVSVWVTGVRVWWILLIGILVAMFFIGKWVFGKYVQK